MRFTPAIFLYLTNRNSEGKSGVSLSFNPAPIKRGKLSTKLGSFVVPLSFSRNSDPRSGDARVPQESHQRAVCTVWCGVCVWGRWGACVVCGVIVYEGGEGGGSVSASVWECRGGEGVRGVCRVCVCFWVWGGDGERKG
jgi:hypothetical protein